MLKFFRETSKKGRSKKFGKNLAPRFGSSGSASAYCYIRRLHNTSIN